MKKRKSVVCILIILFLLIAFGMTVGIEWAYDTFGHLSIDEVIFHLKVPMEGTNTDLIWTFAKQCLWKVIVPTIIISFVLIYPMVKDLKIIEDKIHTSEKRRTIVINLSIAILILIANVTKVIRTSDISEYISNQMNNSTFIEKEYVEPSKVDISFDRQKRNLIYIYLESMESTYYSKEDGGLADQDLIPEISKLAKQNTNFTNTENIGGAYTLYGTTWTVGAMTAQTSGIPLKISVDGNSLSEYSSFLKGAYSLGDVLEKNDYHNYLLLGSDATFGGRSNLFKQHGNYEIYDFETAVSENKVSEKIWWGYTDATLFKYAKEKIGELAKEDRPFNFTMLTADTHFPDGYVCDNCLEQWDKQYKNVISCSSRRVGELVQWIQKQDFYDNTTIVIVGDHLTMQTDFFPIEEGQDYEKKVVSLIINPAEEAKNTKNRIYSTMDLYPTTLTAIGAKIEGNRLALGTNLFSDEQTLLEKYGVEYINDELKKTSKFYDRHILQKR